MLIGFVVNDVCIVMLRLAKDPVRNTRAYDGSLSVLPCEHLLCTHGDVGLPARYWYR